MNEVRRRVVVHPTDLLVEVDGEVPLGAVEAELVGPGLTLDVELAGRRDLAVGAWLAAGAPGARAALEDPADHLVAGLEGTLPDGAKLVVRPEPRRAVGPDLVALAVGAGARFVRVTKAWLRVHRVDAPRPSLPLPACDLDAPLSDGEARLLDAIARELAAPR